MVLCNEWQQMYLPRHPTCCLEAEPCKDAQVGLRELQLQVRHQA